MPWPSRSYEFFTSPKDAINNSHKVYACRDGKVETLVETPFGSTSGGIGINWGGALQQTCSIDAVFPVNAFRYYVLDKDRSSPRRGRRDDRQPPLLQNRCPHPSRDGEEVRARHALEVVYSFDMERGRTPSRSSATLTIRGSSRHGGRQAPTVQVSGERSLDPRRGYV